MRAELLSDRLLDTERHRDGVMQRLDSCKRAAARAEKDWELERNNLHVRTTPAGCVASQLTCVLLTNLLQAISVTSDS